MLLSSNTASNKDINSSTASCYFAHQTKWKHKLRLHKLFAEMTSHLSYSKTQAAEYKKKYNYPGSANGILNGTDCILLAWSAVNMNLVCLRNTATIFPGSSDQSQYCHQIIQKEERICGKLCLQTTLLKQPPPFQWGKIISLVSLKSKAKVRALCMLMYTHVCGCTLSSLYPRGSDEFAGASEDMRF